jgi:UDP-N-acetylbacillosamine N-acetyltransferase
MKLLILGAGGHGKDVTETAEDIGYDEIAYLDDNNPMAIGKFDELDKFKDTYENAFVALGNNKLRSDLIKRLKEAGYNVPSLIHPSAYISRSATIGDGTIIEPRAVLNARCKIGEGCIISTGAIIDHDAEIGEYCNIKTGALVKDGWKVENSRKMDNNANIQKLEIEVVNPNVKSDSFEKEYKRLTGREVSFF